MGHALIGGVLLAVSLLSLAVLKRFAGRDPNRRWIRAEALQSLLAVALVSGIAVGLTLIISSAGSGWTAPSVGAAIALAGFVMMILHGKGSRPG